MSELFPELTARDWEEIEKPKVFDQVLCEILAARGMVRTSLHELMQEARQQWEKQQLEATKLELAVEFWKTFPVRGVRFLPKR